MIAEKENEVWTLSLSIEICVYLSRCDIHQTMNDDFLYSLLIDTELCCTSIL